jgi:hypothetical protein
LNDGRIQTPSNPIGTVPLSNFVPRGFGFVHHSIAILYHEVPNPNLTIRNFCIAVGGKGGKGSKGEGGQVDAGGLPAEESEEAADAEATPVAGGSARAPIKMYGEWQTELLYQVRGGSSALLQR